MKKLTVDEQWLLVKRFYETCYFHPEEKRAPFRFQWRPEDAEIENLFQSMLQMKKMMREFYEDFPSLLENMLAVRDEAKIVLKRDPFE